MTATPPPPTERLTAAQARRVALAAQGFRRPRPTRPVGLRDVQGVVDRLAQFQIDSVNVVTRAHHVPLFSRLGPYDLRLLQRAAGEAPRRLFEYWGHEASLIDVRLHPALRWRMAAAVTDAWGRMQQIRAEQPELVDFVRREITDRGPLTAREIEHDELRRHDHWGWNWSSVKTCLEWLFWTGEITAAERTPQFERRYDLTERVLPAAVVAAPTPSDADAALVLVAHAARALGLGSLRCFADYFRLSVIRTRAAVDALTESGELVAVRVDGWSRPVWRWHAATVPRRVQARALLCPFDSMVFERSRLEALFGFRYRIEIYVPEPKRVHGYYVYPFLLGDRFVARVDLKADRAGGVLLVRSAWGEAGAGVAEREVAAELAAELHVMAGWLGLSGVAVGGTGDLAASLALEVGAMH